ncbi:MFS family permease [Sphingobium wenxiniae]|uniref:Major facilitator superfamily (MFS) profile domain-containing protein n=2 Tax=Sphingobium TaxID=165695 RepID=T0HGD5_9SPHN|nr:MULTISPECIES: MFS transporter [Sphingobium]EQA96608.1 hypothetical protein L485_24035 [Sphingobium baderi LL03]KMS64331.1 MFS transporter [Sphingobium baderi LL03]MBB6190446.1 MFS family permease [Sphingobium wenxiniae]TWH95163.1 sugar phosphate permease [Sphingobium wenxiniae]WRD78162.1 MFS transporter [Sphingobium baderi]
MAGSSALQEWKSGWLLVLAAGLGVSLGSIHIYATGLFIQPLEAEFGWSRAQITGGLSLLAVCGVLFSPVVGVAVDRWGSRRIAVPGSLFFCLSLMGLSLAGPSILSWWLLWGVVALAAVPLKPTVWSTAVSAKFTASRGLALAIMLCGTGVGSSLIPIVTHFLIGALGWRGAYVALGGLFAVIVVPALWLFFVDVRHQDKGRPQQALTGWTAREGLRTRQFHQLWIAALLVTTIIVGFVVHLVPMLNWAGLDRGTAVSIAGIVGVTSVAGRLIVGFLFDRQAGPPLGMASVSLPVFTALLLLLFPGSIPVILVAIFLLGLSVGGEYDAIIYLSTRYFGMRNFGTLFGFVAAALLAGVGLGPLIASHLYDQTGSYQSFLLLAIPAGALCAVLIGTLGRYPDHEAAPAAT